jgi:hypothetical protein
MKTAICMRLGPSAPLEHGVSQPPSPDVLARGWPVRQRRTSVAELPSDREKPAGRGPMTAWAVVGAPGMGGPRLRCRAILRDPS